MGLAASVGRSVFLADFTRRAEPFREKVMRMLEREDPLASQRDEELRLVDGRFAAHRAATLLHVVPGGVFLLLAPFQFVPRIRDRHLRVHRWSGRFLLVIGSVASLSGLYFGLFMPYGGRGEATAIALFGGWFFFALLRAFVDIRRGRVASHREWMVRAFAVAIGISTVRLVAMVVDPLLTPAGYGPKSLLVLSVWTGWIVTVLAGELWIRYTRPRVPLVPA